MSAATFSPEEKTALFAALADIQKRLNEAFAPRPMIAKADKATLAREEAKALGHHTVKTFAATIDRTPHWVSDRCKLRIIRTLPGGKPYRIPLSEEVRFNS